MVVKVCHHTIAAQPQKMEGKMGTAQHTLTSMLTSMRLDKVLPPLDVVESDMAQGEDKPPKPEPDFSKSSIRVESPDDVTKGDHFPGRFRLGDPYA